MNRPADTHRLTAFTLIEMVVSLSIISIVFLAMGSVMVLASKAIPDPGAPTNLAFDAGDIAQQMASEFQTATSVTGATDKRIAITVPDRDADGNDETIIYGWDGTAGNPLVRQYNGGTIVTILPSVYEFNLTYTLGPPPPQTAPQIEGPEQLFLQQDSSNSGSGEQAGMKPGDMLAQTFQPALPADASSWRVTRVLFRPSPHSGTDGLMSVSVREVAANREPESLMIDEFVASESGFVSGNWYTATFSNAGGLDPSKEHCIVLWGTSGAGTIGMVDIGKNSSGSPATRFFKGKNNGSWIEDASRDMWVSIWGTVSTPDPTWTPSSGTLKSVVLTLNPGTDPASRVRTTVTALNRPDMP